VNSTKDWKEELNNVGWAQIDGITSNDEQVGLARRMDSPERSVQARLPQEGLLRSGRRGTPLVAQPARVPPAAKLPQRLDRHRSAEVDSPPRRPPGRVRFRPEGQDVASGEADVVPEAPDRNGEADYGAIGGFGTPVGNRQIDASTGVGTGGSRPSVDAEKQRDRERVPGAVGPVVRSPRAHAEGRLHGGEGMSHPDFTGVVQNQSVGFCEECQRPVNFAR